MLRNLFCLRFFGASLLGDDLLGVSAPEPFQPVLDVPMHGALADQNQKAQEQPQKQHSESSTHVVQRQDDLLRDCLLVMSSDVFQDRHVVVEIVQQFLDDSGVDHLRDEHAEPMLQREAALADHLERAHEDVRGEPENPVDGFARDENSVEKNDPLLIADRFEVLDLGPEVLRDVVGFEKELIVGVIVFKPVVELLAAADPKARLDDLVDRVDLVLVCRLGEHRYQLRRVDRGHGQCVQRENHEEDAQRRPIGPVVGRNAEEHGPAVQRTQRQQLVRAMLGHRVAQHKPGERREKKYAHER